jgi:hypothetical protein
MTEISQEDKNRGVKEEDFAGAKPAPKDETEERAAAGNADVPAHVHVAVDHGEHEGEIVTGPVFRGPRPDPDAEKSATTEATASSRAPQTGKLADDFPGKDALTAAGYGTYGKVRALVEDDDNFADDIPGIGAATAAKIKAALG